VPTTSICSPFNIEPALAVVLESSASQEERINMLNIALIEKGVVTSTRHYESRHAPMADSQQLPAPLLDAPMDGLNGDNEGIVL